MVSMGVVTNANSWVIFVVMPSIYTCNFCVYSTFVNKIKSGIYFLFSFFFCIFDNICDMWHYYLQLGCIHTKKKIKKKIKEKWKKYLLIVLVFTNMMYFVVWIRNTMLGTLLMVVCGWYCCCYRCYTVGNWRFLHCCDFL